MDIYYSPSFSLDETAAQVENLEEFVSTSETPFIQNDTVTDMQDALGNRVASSASELMTGMRLHGERQQYLEAYEVYRRLLGAVALDTATREYDEHEDADKVKNVVNEYLKNSKLKMVAEDYAMRLEKSPVERAKQRVAQNDKARFAVPFTLSSGIGSVGLLATAFFIKANEVPSLSSLELSPTQKGIATAATLAAGLLTRTLLRSGTKQAGTMIGDQANVSIRTYMLDKLDGNDESTPEDIQNLIGRYAMRHLESHNDKLGRSLLEYKLETREDIEPMVDSALDVSEAAMHKSYGIDPDNEWPGPWYLRIPSKVLRVNLAS